MAIIHANCNSDPTLVQNLCVHKILQYAMKFCICMRVCMESGIHAHMLVPPVSLVDL
jgi:hypothetical protein